MMPAAKRLQSVRWLAARALLRLGVPLRLHSADRRVLEQQILPHLAEAPFDRVLFVGCDWYTQRYERLFRGKDYATIEIDAARRPFGAKRHIVGSLADLGRHFAPGRLDLILCNGVFGWGLDGREETERAFAECAAALSPGGVLLLGWDDVPEHRPFDPLPLLEEAGFHPWVFGPFASARHTVDRHVYDFVATPAT